MHLAPLSVSTNSLRLLREWLCTINNRNVKAVLEQLQVLLQSTLFPGWQFVDFFFGYFERLLQKVFCSSFSVCLIIDLFNYIFMVYLLLFIFFSCEQNRAKHAKTIMSLAPNLHHSWSCWKKMRMQNANAQIGAIRDMRFEGLSIGKRHVKNLPNRARFGGLMVCRKNANFQDFRP